MNPELLLPVAFALVAFVYAAVGFGGGSSYLALLALASLPFQEIRLAALICNIVVVLGNSVLFSRMKLLNWRKSLPLVAVSVPIAFLGARLPLHEKMFFLLLGISLIFAAILLWLQIEKRAEDTLQNAIDRPVRDGILGGLIGLLSGMVSIGGGIFLSPILHFLRWDTARKIAATASLFILVNSVAGIAGQLLSLTITPNWTFIGWLGMAVFIGGQLGLRFSLQTFNHTLIRRITASLVLFAGLELLWKHIFGQ